MYAAFLPFFVDESTLPSSWFGCVQPALSLGRAVLLDAFVFIYFLGRGACAELGPEVFCGKHSVLYGMLLPNSEDFRLSRCGPRGPAPRTLGSGPVCALLFFLSAGRRRDVLFHSLIVIVSIVEELETRSNRHTVFFVSKLRSFYSVVNCVVLQGAFNATRVKGLSARSWTALRVLLATLDRGLGRGFFTFSDLT